MTRPVELHGVSIPAECKIALLTGSAGRDEREYPDADRFDVRRTFSRHASFGYGPHFCLGAALARLEARVALEETLARFPTWDIDESGLRWVHTSTVRGYETVPFTRLISPSGPARSRRAGARGCGRSASDRSRGPGSAPTAIRAASALVIAASCG